LAQQLETAARNCRSLQLLRLESAGNFLKLLLPSAARAARLLSIIGGIVVVLLLLQLLKLLL
jgi:hypothetical protein